MRGIGGGKEGRGNDIIIFSLKIKLFLKSMMILYSHAFQPS